MPPTAPSCEPIVLTVGVVSFYMFCVLWWFKYLSYFIRGPPALKWKITDRELVIPGLDILPGTDHVDDIFASGGWQDLCLGLVQGCFLFVFVHLYMRPSNA